VPLPYHQVYAAIKNIQGKVIKLTSETPIPIIHRYSTPETLGKDRLAAAVGATVIFPGSSCLVIDAGTAITYDYIKDGREYMGGNISPGIDIRFKSLHDFTSRLPLITEPQTTDTFGLSTIEALSNGVITGIIHEIEGYISRFEKKNVNSNIILTGGSSIYLSKKLKNTIFAEPNLVTIGLNRILNYNVLKEN
jgi:type III pantothenate kinase